MMQFNMYPNTLILGHPQAPLVYTHVSLQLLCWNPMQHCSIARFQHNFTPHTSGTSLLSASDGKDMQPANIVLLQAKVLRYTLLLSPVHGPYCSGTPSHPAQCMDHSAQVRLPTQPGAWTIVLRYDYAQIG
jgi:hypothetical protein